MGWRQHRFYRGARENVHGKGRRALLLVRLVMLGWMVVSGSGSRLGCGIRSMFPRVLCKSLTGAQMAAAAPLIITSLPVVSTNAATAVISTTSATTAAITAAAATARMASRKRCSSPGEVACAIGGGGGGGRRGGHA